MFLLGDTFIGFASPAFSALFNAGRWQVQVPLIAAGIGMYGLDRGQPIVFHLDPLLAIIVEELPGSQISASLTASPASTMAMRTLSTRHTFGLDSGPASRPAP